MNWPSTSSSPVTPIGPPGSPRVSTTSSSSGDTGSSPRSPARIAAHRVSVVSTGIGTDNVEIVVAEILAITERPTFIRVGSCGALQPEIALGDLIISTGAVRLESTTSYFVHDGYPAVADYEAVLALIEAGGAARTPDPRRVDGHGTGVLRGARAPDPAAAHPLP